MEQSIGKDNSWALNDQASDETISLLGRVPSRWGRMTPLSRLMIVEVGGLLQQKGILQKGQRCSELGLTVGLVGGTRRGSLYTDIDFVKSMANGPGMSSPALFGYTLANTPLAEAAGQFGLVGPVYALVDTRNPHLTAEREARLLLQMQPAISLMIACEFDHYSCTGQDEKLLATLTLVGRDADSYPDISKVE